MAIIVEDGTGVPGANSYVTVAEFEAYALARGVTLTGTPTSEQLLLRAMDYIESLEYIGDIAICGQPLMWPRYGVYIDGYCYVDGNTIPELLKNAQMVTALSIDAGMDPLSQFPTPRLVHSTTVGPITVEYEQGQPYTTIIRRVSAMLRRLIRGTGMAFCVSRGSCR